jgi:hypothetical protein
MKFRNLALSIAGLFVAGLVIDICLLQIVTSGKYPPIWGDEPLNLRIAILVLYGVPLGVILGGLISTMKRRDSVSLGLATVFFCLVLVWNTLAVMPMYQFVFGEAQKVNDCITSLNSLADKGSFLVSACLAYFFGAAKISG